MSVLRDQTAVDANCALRRPMSVLRPESPQATAVADRSRFGWSGGRSRANAHGTSVLLHDSAEEGGHSFSAHDALAPAAAPALPKGMQSASVPLGPRSVNAPAGARAAASARARRNGLYMARPPFTPDAVKRADAILSARAVSTSVVTVGCVSLALPMPVPVGDTSLAEPAARALADAFEAEAQEQVRADDGPLSPPRARGQDALDATRASRAVAPTPASEWRSASSPEGHRYYFKRTDKIAVWAEDLPGDVVVEEVVESRWRGSSGGRKGGSAAAARLLASPASSIASARAGRSGGMPPSLAALEGGAGAHAYGPEVRLGGRVVTRATAALPVPTPTPHARGAPLRVPPSAGGLPSPASFLSPGMALPPRAQAPASYDFSLVEAEDAPAAARAHADEGGGEEGGEEEGEGGGPRTPCEECGRLFAPSRLAVHSRVCRSVWGTRRSPFPTALARLKDTPASSLTFASKALPPCGGCGKRFPVESDAREHALTCRMGRRAAAAAAGAGAATPSGSAPGTPGGGVRSVRSRSRGSLGRWGGPERAGGAFEADTSAISIVSGGSGAWWSMGGGASLLLGGGGEGGGEGDPTAVPPSAWGASPAPSSLRSSRGPSIARRLPFISPSMQPPLDEQSREEHSRGDSSGATASAGEAEAAAPPLPPRTASRTASAVGGTPDPVDPGAPTAHVAPPPSSLHLLKRKMGEGRAASRGRPAPALLPAPPLPPAAVVVAAAPPTRSAGCDCAGCGCAFRDPSALVEHVGLCVGWARRIAEEEEAEEEAYARSQVRSSSPSTARSAPTPPGALLRSPVGAAVARALFAAPPSEVGKGRGWEEGGGASPPSDPTALHASASPWDEVMPHSRALVIRANAAAEAGEAAARDAGAAAALLGKLAVGRGTRGYVGPAR
jgi:hypothetical protein